MNKFKRTVLTLFFSTALTLSALAETMDIKGVIIDKSSREPLIGATVVIVGSNTGAATDLDGTFELDDIQEGVYDIEVAYMGYKTAIYNNVKIDKDALDNLQFEMEADNVLLEDIVVTGTVNTESENGALVDQKQSLFATQIVAAKELSRKGVGDAEGAVAKVSGVSKQEGVKNVFVRGLGDRYNTTTLNGFAIPSEDPEYKNISLDFFTTDIINSVVVDKVFGIASSSDVGGANINITSKQLRGDKDLNVSLSGGVNTQVLGKELYLPNGMNSMGFADASQPSSISSYNFANSLNPEKSNLNINNSFGISGGKSFEVAGNDLDLYVVGAYDQKFMQYEEQVRNASTNGTLTQDQVAEKSSASTSLVALANLDYDMSAGHNIAYNFMAVHSGTQSLGDYVGLHKNFESAGSVDGQGIVRRQQMNDNTLLVNQISSTWTLTERVGLDAGLSYNHVNGTEPDRRINNMILGADGYTLLAGTGEQQRNYTDLSEGDLNTRAIFSYALSADEQNQSAIRVGYIGRIVSNEFEATEYDMGMTSSGQMVVVAQDVNSIDLESVFNGSNLNRYFTLDKNNDMYSVDKTIHSALLDATYQFNPSLIVNLGLKYDMVDMVVDYNVNRGGTKGSNSIDKDYILPSLNVRYDLSDEHTLRLSASKTYTLPQAKEIAPYRYVGANFDSQGNQELQPSDNYNFDLKWDYYLGRGELLSVTGFYKHIVDPISRIKTNSAGGFLTYANVADKALAAGVELELRKNIFSKEHADQKRSTLSAGFNGSYIHTHVDIPFATEDDGTQLEGAAPWIVNADLTYQSTNDQKSFMATLVLNYVSDRVFTFGTLGEQDIMQKQMTTLDLVLSRKFNKWFSVSLKASNLIDTPYVLMREATESTPEIIFNEYHKGRTVTLGVSCNF